MWLDLTQSKNCQHFTKKNIGSKRNRVMNSRNRVNPAVNKFIDQLEKPLISIVCQDWMEIKVT